VGVELLHRLEEVPFIAGGGRLRHLARVEPARRRRVLLGQHRVTRRHERHPGSDDRQLGDQGIHRVRVGRRAEVPAAIDFGVVRPFQRIAVPDETTADQHIDDLERVCRPVFGTVLEGVAAAVNQQIDGDAFLGGRLGQIADDIGSEAEPEQDKPGLRIFAVELLDLVIEVPTVIELAAVGLGEADGVQVVAQAAEVGPVAGIHAADHEDVDVAATGRRQAAARLAQLFRRGRHRMDEAHAAGGRAQRGRQQPSPQRARPACLLPHRPPPSHRTGWFSSPPTSCAFPAALLSSAQPARCLDNKQAKSQFWQRRLPRLCRE